MIENIFPGTVRGTEAISDRAVAQGARAIPLTFTAARNQSTTDPIGCGIPDSDHAPDGPDQSSGRGTGGNQESGRMLVQLSRARAKE